MFRLEDGNFIFSIHVGTPQIKPFQMSTVIMTLIDLCSKNNHSELKILNFSITFDS